MRRKTRRRLQRKPRKRKKGNKYLPKNIFVNWYNNLNRPCNNRFVRVTTWLMFWIEFLFLLVCAIWAFIEVTARLFGWFGGY